MKARTFFIFTMLIIILIAGHCQAQSFYAHKQATDRGRCEVVHHKKTLSQKLLNKVKYNRKRHNNEAFALRERRKYIRKNGI